MRIPKKYGQSKISQCPFCENTAVIKNKQDIPVCQRHKDAKLDDLKCICGSWLELHSGKWGPYFRCPNCGNINFKKALEINPNPKPTQTEQTQTQTATKKSAEKPKEIRITSDDVDYFD